jgi:L-threonylcarbamoyladenylate synthase
MLDHFHAMGKSVGLLLSTENAGKLFGEHLEILGSRDRPAVLAANLYGALRRFDLQGVDIILAEGYPSEGIGLALMNRLSKAAGHRVIHVE